MYEFAKYVEPSYVRGFAYTKWLSVDLLAAFFFAISHTFASFSVTSPSRKTATKVASFGIYTFRAVVGANVGHFQTFVFVCEEKQRAK